MQHILSKQQPGGGWGFSDSRADVDLTAMALQALAGYQNRAEVKKAIENGVNWLSTAQNADGGFSVNGLETSESCAQVLTAMSTLGIAPDDVVLPRHVARAIAAELACRRTRADAIVLNQADDAGGMAAARDVARELAVLLGSECPRILTGGVRKGSLLQVG